MSGLKQSQHRFSIRTDGQGFYDVTDRIASWVSEQAIACGLLTVFIRHTSASLVIQENADPDVRRDLAAFFARLVPEDPSLYRHGSEGPDDMPAHIRSALTATQHAVPVADGRLALGIWQGIYVFEHRAAPHTRNLVLHLIGE
jgi:secondary thiamine-phosphate synthase enzyme